MTAIILAGGKSSRMGRDKAFLKMDGVPMIKRQLKTLRGFFKKIIIVTNSPHKSRTFYKLLYGPSKKVRDKYKFRNVKIIRDVVLDCGPLGGIYSGLLESRSFYNFVVACDMPFLNEALIRYIIAKKDNNDIIIPKIKKRFHPLFGIYSKNCIPIIEGMLKRGRLKVSNIFSKVKTHFISEKEIERFDERMLSLVNINVREDLAMAKKIRKV